MDWQASFQSLIDQAATLGIKLLVSLVLLFPSFLFINFLSARLGRSIEKRKADKTVARTVTYTVKIGLKLLVLSGLIGYIGIDTGGLTALIASLGVGVGLAVNGALSNLAGGVLLLICRPFRIDDYIEAQGFSGTVEAIRIISTRLLTPDNKVIYIPNGALSSGTIVNYSMQRTRRTEASFPIAYGADLALAKRVALSFCQTHPLILQEPAPFVGVGALGEHAVQLTVRAFTESQNYWAVHFDLLEGVKARFDEAGIAIPFHQLDVHIQ